MIAARTVDELRFLAVALAFPNSPRLAVVDGLARALNLEAAFHNPLQEVLEPQFHRLFTGQHRCSPHQTEYGPGRSVRKAVELADIAGFYRAFGLAIDQADPEMVDHLSLELDFLAHVGFKLRYAALRGWRQQAEICDHAYREFWQDHLRQWVGVFFAQLEQVAEPEGFYRSVARFGSRLVATELSRLGLQAGAWQLDNRELSVDECLGCVASEHR